MSKENTATRGVYFHLTSDPCQHFLIKVWIPFGGGVIIGFLLGLLIGWVI